MGSTVRKLRTLLALTAAVAAAAALPSTASAASAFVIGCDYSHSAHDDPIVHPRQPGAAPHQHDFLGNPTTDAFSSHESLRAAGSGKCNVWNEYDKDLSAYWVPSLYERQADGSFRLWEAHHQQVYYSAGISDETRVKPFPRGLKMIAGDAAATEPQPTTTVMWGCDGEWAVDGGTRPWCVDNPGDPGLPTSMRATINFPSCNDGRTDSPDHRSHMAHPVRASTGARVCPASHPKAVPAVQMIARYKTPGGPDADVDPLPGAVRLDSGGHYSMHADFFEAWDPLRLQALIATCIHLSATSCT